VNPLVTRPAGSAHQRHRRDSMSMHGPETELRLTTRGRIQPAGVRAIVIAAAAVIAMIAAACESPTSAPYRPSRHLVATIQFDFNSSTGDVHANVLPASGTTPEHATEAFRAVRSAVDASIALDSITCTSGCGKHKIGLHVIEFSIRNTSSVTMDSIDFTQAAGTNNCALTGTMPFDFHLDPEGQPGDHLHVKLGADVTDGTQPTFTINTHVFANY
jgi:hypothetical protein